MRVNEITNADYVESFLHKINEIDPILISTHVSHNNYEMYRTSSDKMYVYYVKDNNKIIAAVICLPLKINDISYLQTKQVFIEKAYRGSDLAVYMYYSIKMQEKMNLISDDTQTPEGKALWKKLSQRFDIAVMDTNTTEIRHDINVNDVYSANINNLVLVTETDMSWNLIIPYLRIPRRSLIQ